VSAKGAACLRVWQVLVDRCLEPRLGSKAYERTHPLMNVGHSASQRLAPATCRAAGDRTPVSALSPRLAPPGLESVGHSRPQSGFHRSSASLGPARRLPAVDGAWEDPPVYPTLDSDSDGYTEDEDGNDSDGSVHPGAVETCDGVDDDCDGTVDEDVTTTFFEDQDGDT
jgi:hypothetical protein